MTSHVNLSGVESEEREIRGGGGGGGGGGGVQVVYLSLLDKMIDKKNELPCSRALSHFVHST